jgi:hypothetical protein
MSLKLFLRFYIIIRWMSSRLWSGLLARRADSSQLFRLAGKANRAVLASLLGRGTTSRAELVSTPRSNYETQQRGVRVRYVLIRRGKPTEIDMGGAEGNCERRRRETGEL